MREKDYYETLGVERTADESDIRAAFRRLAKQHHPDLSGCKDSRRFQEILNAYSILSDPETRSSYDESLRKREAAIRAKARQRVTVRTTATIVTQHRSHPYDRNARFRESSVSETMDLFFRDFTGQGRSRRYAPVDLEVLLSREEASRGGVLQLLGAGVVRCPACRGDGHTLFFRCTSCFGRGTVENEKPVWIRIPAGVGDGSVLEVSIQSSGPASTTLRVIVRVSDMEMSHGFY